MPKVTFIGAGSQKFVRASVVDMFQYEELHDSDIVLMDIKEERLTMTEQVIKNMASEKNIPVNISATTDRKKALEGTDFVIVTIMVGGMKHYKSDTFIPEKHGVSVAAGDTIGPGAVMRLVRTAPVVQGIVNDLKEVAPDAWVFSYVNPMAMVTKAYISFGHENTVGLCHAIQGAYREIADWLSIPAEEIEYSAAGINHLNFYHTLTFKAKDLYPLLLEKADEIIKTSKVWEATSWEREANGYERVRMEVMQHFGRFPVEGPWHQGEYYPYFRKNPELVKYYGPKTGWGLEFDTLLTEYTAKENKALASGEKEFDFTPSIEFGIPIMHALTSGHKEHVYGNVLNKGAIENLPDDALVEVPCIADGNGLHPEKMGKIPTQLAGLMRNHITVHELAMEAVLEKNREKLYYAIQADPLTAACLTLPQIKAMSDELLKENEEFISDWK